MKLLNIILGRTETKLISPLAREILNEDNLIRQLYDNLDKNKNIFTIISENTGRKYKITIINSY
jgi:hypothetical protein